MQQGRIVTNIRTLRNIDNRGLEYDEVTVPTGDQTASSQTKNGGEGEADEQEEEEQEEEEEEDEEEEEEDEGEEGEPPNKPRKKPAAA